MIIDTHSHLNANAFKDDFDEVIKRTLADDIWMVNVGMDYETSKKAIEIAEKYNEGVYASIGLHPTDTVAEFLNIKDIQGEIFDKEKYKELVKSSEKVVAVGEIGLDYYHKPKTTAKLQAFKEKQKKVFLEQLDLAKELNLPAILHCRMAHQDMIQILNSKFHILNSKANGVIHCFTGTVEEMKQYIDLGFFVGFNGIIFKLPLDEVIKNCPLENMVIETDCPYLTPLQEGDKRNEPIFIKHTIKRIAELKRMSFQEVAEKTTQNAKQLFASDFIL